MKKHLTIDGFEITTEPQGEIARITVAARGERVWEATVHRSAGGIPVAFTHQGRPVTLVLSPDGTSAVMGDGTVVSKRWFLAMDFLSVAHRALGLRWKHEGLQIAVNLSFDAAVALVTASVSASVILRSSAWAAFLVHFVVWLGFFLISDGLGRRSTIRSLQRRLQNAQG